MPITLTLPDGRQVEAPEGITGLELAEQLSPRLAQEALAIEVDGEVWDLTRPIPRSARVRVLTWADEWGRKTYWHSTAHVMAEALEALFPGVKFGIGPPIDNGFYYDVDLGDRRLTGEDLARLEEKMRDLIRRNVPFERREVSKAEAIAYFRQKGDPYKLELLEELADGTITFYRQGDFTDLCRGPHLPSTGYIKHVKLLNTSGAYWRGRADRPQLTRIYGISFPKESQLKEYLRRLEEAKKRDHRKLGQELELFLFDPKVGQGLPIWLPKGAVIRYELERFLREEQQRRGYQVVYTPHVGNIELYKTSGHYPYYKDSQFPPMRVEDEEYLLKPMNCPHHFMIYASRPRSYRELPLRIAEFGTVYRYEQSGELAGLVRVRGFTQDDAHIFVSREGLREELCAVIALTQHVFRKLGLQEVSVRLSFRDPANKAKYGGSDELWQQAEADVLAAAERMGLAYFVGIGEASFYGPKIDFMVRDVLGRSWQLGTVQVDYVMPERFNLEYIGADGRQHRPVVIHRAPFGSFERLVGLLIEHYGGAFPTWLAPVQVVVIPVSEAHLPYAQAVYQSLLQAEVRAELDGRDEKVGYKIRYWELQKVPYMLVVGAQEQASGTVAVRRHRRGDQGRQPLEVFLAALRAEIHQRMLNMEESGHS
ncbi:MAG: threonine--tRNA ligase [Bacteroidetes bacterium]|nr:threonine--tRNA ligase [Rhodothermia bacterium]MCX7906362.1 threonine--tRNA ligase [Bacteroidota bacterium]MDW8285608.1 threonine--tRNA ligase [Bacteroidota bacterium]